MSLDVGNLGVQLYHWYQAKVIAFGGSNWICSIVGVDSKPWVLSWPIWRVPAVVFFLFIRNRIKANYKDVS